MVNIILFGFSTEFSGQKKKRVFKDINMGHRDESNASSLKIIQDFSPNVI